MKGHHHSLPGNITGAENAPRPGKVNLDDPAESGYATAMVPLFGGVKGLRAALIGTDPRL